MNSLDSLIREHMYNLSTTDINITKIYLVLFFLLWFVGAYLFYLGFRKKDWIIIFMGITILINFPISMMYQWKKINFNVNNVNMKQEYNITLEEKDKTIELLYNENKESSKYIKKEYIKDKFKVVFTKDNEENYYIYFDEKADEKKTTSFKEIQQFVKSQVDYEYYEALDNFKIKDLSKNKNKHKEETDNNETDKTTVDELQKKLDELKKKENTKKEVSDKETNTEQLQKQLDELKKKIDKKNSDE